MLRLKHNLGVSPKTRRLETSARTSSYEAVRQHGTLNFLFFLMRYNVTVLIRDSAAAIVTCGILYLGEQSTPS